MQSKNDAAIVACIASGCRWLRRIPGKTTPLFLCAFWGIVCGPLVLLVTGAGPGPESVIAPEMDRSIKPGDDFYRFANGGWLARVSIPAGSATSDTRAMLAERASRRELDLVQEAAASRGAGGSGQQKVGDYYRRFMYLGGITGRGRSAM